MAFLEVWIIQFIFNGLHKIHVLHYLLKLDVCVRFAFQWIYIWGLYYQQIINGGLRIPVNAGDHLLFGPFL